MSPLEQAGRLSDLADGLSWTAAPVCIQLRAKTTSTRAAFLELANRLHDLDVVCVAPSSIVNDRADIAQAGGCRRRARQAGRSCRRRQLGRSSDRMPLSDYRPTTEQQIGRAMLEPISYIAIGPVFETATKATGYAAVGLEAVRHRGATPAPRRADWE